MLKVTSQTAAMASIALCMAAISAAEIEPSAVMVWPTTDTVSLPLWPAMQTLMVVAPAELHSLPQRSPSSRVLPESGVVTGVAVPAMLLSRSW